ncbi:hypothetical protein [Nocardia sp. XZ_19_231]|uniref:hypothetical protein n=1 Tax=Nocardia sp. XZ_19_231 TaxID=2769252 RepID=UPI00188E3A55|nr:hypothetical protein [Nocardia sp. XZ_19_231]
MRIIRGNSDPNDDNEHNHDHGRKQQPASESDAARMAETLVDEAEAFLAAQADAHPFEPEPEPKPVARLVKSLTGEQTAVVPVEDENLIPALRPQPDQPAAPTGRKVPRWVRTALPGSVVVVTLAVVVTHGQPEVVAVPIDIYAGCWVGFLFWNAAHRPPLRDVAAATISAAIGLVAAVLSLFAHGIRALVTGIGHRRGRFETARTAH